MVVMNSVPPTIAASENAAEWAISNADWLKVVFEKHEDILSELGVEKHQAAYDGFLECIDERDKSRGDDVNNKLQVNMAQMIIDTPVDYMTGKPITWTVYDPEDKASKDTVESYRKELIGILKSEETKRSIAELLRQGGIAGYSGIISWVDEDGQISFDEYPVQELIPIFDPRGRLKLVLRKFLVEEGTNKYSRLEYYDEKYVAYFNGDDQGQNYHLDLEEAATGNPIEHKAARIPVSIYINGTPSRYVRRLKKSGVSDLDNGVMTLIENYAAVMSDKANTVENLLDQYLLLEGVTVDEKEVIKMRKARALVLKAADSRASFIAPQQEDTAVENHLDREKATMHDMSGVPNIRDISGVTATEIKMKYAPLDIKAGKKEIYFLAAIRHLVQTITDMLNMRRLITAGVTAPFDVLKGANKPGAEKNTSIELYKSEWVDITINRNLPQNFMEIAQIVGMLVDVVPDAYLYELLWFIEDPTAALEEMKKQKKATAEATASAGLAAMGLGGEFSSTGTSNEGGEE